MITGLIQAKKWKKRAAAALAGLAAASGVFCLGLYLLPVWEQSLDATAMIAAQTVVPEGAAQILFGGVQEAVQSAVSKAESASSKEEPEASAVVSERESSAVSSEAERPRTVWKGKKTEIWETTLENSGQYGAGIFVKNDTDYDLDIAGTLAETPDLSIVQDGTPQVLLYHTHTCESYLQEASDTFYSDMPTRSTNPEESVIAVGEAIARELQKANIGVIHDTTIHDASYNGSYNRSAETISKNLQKYPSIQVTIDIHRDAMITEAGNHYKPTVTIDGKKAAQIMIICGYDGDGSLDFPDWEYNLRLGLRLQKASSAVDANFARPLSFCNRNYNENMTHNSLLVEFGTESNTVAEAVYAGQLFGKQLAAVLGEFTAEA